MASKYKTAPWPYFSKDEISAVNKVLRSGRVNQWTGQEVFSLEKEYANSLGVKYAIALSNGSVALDMALMALDIEPGDEVIVPSRSFVASASCVALRGAIPVFSDIDRNSQNITVSEIEKVFTKKTKAIIAVHLAGWPCELKEIRDFCDKEGIFLVEDCAQAHGARYKNRPVGSFGDVSCFSFCQDKIISTAGEGGLLVTNDKDIWQKVWSFKDHGRDYNTMFNKKDSNSFLWAVSGFGSNYRMTEIQAAIGRIALSKLGKWVNRRRELADILTKGFKELPQLRVTVPSDREYHSYYKYYVFVNKDRLRKGLSRNKVVHSLNNKGIPCGTGICPEIYMEKAFAEYRKRMKSPRLKIARELAETSIMFQVHPTLKECDMYRVVDEVEKVLN